MWIRSQGKIGLVICNHVFMMGNKIAERGKIEITILGKYDTEKRCLEVMDEIHSAIINEKKAYQMPEK